MCFSGRPFLHGIQIFLSGFWVSSRGTDGVSCSMAAREPLGAAGGGSMRCVSSSRGSPAEGDRCFICDAPRRDGGKPVPLLSTRLWSLARLLALGFYLSAFPVAALKRGLAASHVLMCYGDFCTSEKCANDGSSIKAKKCARKIK